MPISLPSFLVKGCGEEAPHTGTTIIACKYKDANGGGVVLGADGRVSVGNCESMADILTCMAVMITLSSPPRHFQPSVEQDCTPRRARLFAAVRISSDAQIVSDHISYYVHGLEAESGRRASVDTVAQLVMQMNYQNKDNLVGALIIAGYDEVKGGLVFGCPIGGTLSSEEWAIDGSGSTFIWGYCDSAFRSDFSREEAERFVEEAVALAMSSDASSGGCIRLVTINKEGAHHKYTNGANVALFDQELGVPMGGSGGMVLG